MAPKAKKATDTNPARTPQRKDRDPSTGRQLIGPDPVALKAGTINPAREGLILAAVLAGTGGSTVSELMAATGLRNPTVRYFGISAAEANLIDTVKVGNTFHLIVRKGDSNATKAAVALRERVLEMVKAAEAAPAPKKEKADAKAK